MKYAIVNVQSAELKGIKHSRHKKSADKRYMIVNENELKLYGNPDEVATELGGELVDIDSIKKQINTKTWGKK